MTQSIKVKPSKPKKPTKGSYKGDPRQRRKRVKGVKYTNKLAEYILDEIEKGRTLTSICKEDGLPAPATVYKWVRDDHEAFTDKYRQARETQLNYFIDLMNDIADMPPPVPPEFVENEKGEQIKLEGGDRKLWVNAENMRRRLKVDTIKFQAAKLAGVMGYNTDAGVTIKGDVVNIINYATEAPIEVINIEPADKEVKQVNFIDTTEKKK